MHLTIEHPNTVHEAKLIEFQGEIHESTIIIGDLNTLLSEMDRSRRQKINNEVSNIISQQDMRDNCSLQLEQLDIRMQKMNLDTDLKPFAKKLKMNHRLKCKL